MAPEGYGILAYLVAIIAGIIVGTLVGRRSVRRRDGQEWWQCMLAGFGTMIGVAAILLLIGDKVLHIGN